MFWENVKKESKKQKLKQEDLAKKVDMSYETLRSWISKGTLPRVDKAIAIANVLKTTVEHLFTRDEDLSYNTLDLANKIDGLSPEDKEDILVLLNNKLKRKEKALSPKKEGKFPQKQR